MNVIARVSSKQTNGARGDTRYIPEVRLLADNLCPHCGESPLDVSRANYLDKINHQGCHKNRSNSALQLAMIPLQLLFMMSHGDEHKSPLQMLDQSQQQPPIATQWSTVVPNRLGGGNHQE
jgi:hypothetical protein